MHLKRLLFLISNAFIIRKRMNIMQYLGICVMCDLNDHLKDLPMRKIWTTIEIQRTWNFYNYWIFLSRFSSHSKCLNIKNTNLFDWIWKRCFFVSSHIMEMLINFVLSENYELKSQKKNSILTISLMRRKK